MHKKTFFFIVSIFIFMFMVSMQSIYAYTDNLIIQDDGNIVLLITTSGAVLGDSTVQSTPKKTDSTPQPQTNAVRPPQQTSPASHVPEKQSIPPSNTAPQASEKTVPLVPPHTNTTVQINPPVNNNKKIQVTITTSVSQQSPSSTPIPSTPPNHVSVGPTEAAHVQQPHPSQSLQTRPVVTTKTVDSVVATSSNGNAVITITSQKANQLTIKQGATTVTTSLPLQIDTLNHSFLAAPTNQSATINVLPQEAMKGIVNTGIITKTNALTATLHLTQDTTGLSYSLTTRKQGKVFGIFPVNSSVQIRLSAQNGKVVTIQQPLLFNIFGGLIK